MRMPFGLDFWSFVAGLAFAYFVLPFILGMVGRARGGGGQAAEA
jgi:Sec-independent protein secretion pathway component TatC